MAKPLSIEQRCQAKVAPNDRWGIFHQHQCYKKAVIERDGKRYCKIHDPEYIKQKDKERQAKWDKEWEVRRIQYYGHDLLRACKEALELTTEDNIKQILQKAINEAEGVK